MRTLIITSALAFVAACNGKNERSVDRIVVTMTGENAQNFEINRVGKSHYRQLGDQPQRKDFQIDSARFAALEREIEEYRPSATPFNDKDIDQHIASVVCDDGTKPISDAGTVYVRWTGQRIDTHYFSDLGCGTALNRTRNAHLLHIVEGLTSLIG